MEGRRRLGLLSLVLGISALWVLSRIKTCFWCVDPNQWLFAYALMVWYGLTILNKIGMIFNQRQIEINVMAGIAWVIMIIIALGSSSSPSKSITLAGYNNLYLIVILGLPIVDLVDFALTDSKQQWKDWKPKE